MRSYKGLCQYSSENPHPRKLINLRIEIITMNGKRILSNELTCQNLDIRPK